MKTLKKLLSALLVAVMLLSAAPITASAWWDPGTAEVYESGSCGLNAHYTCDKKTGTLVISGTGEIDDNSFARSDIRSVIIENGITEICSGAFAYCENMTSITMPDSVTSIGMYAFDDCTGLTSITIPDSVTSIGWNVFSDCTSLTSIIIGNSVTSINEGAFSGCTGLTSITIGNSVTSIGDFAFSGCTGLTSITIPNSVTSIGEYAFSGCTELTNISIPDSVTSTYSDAFSNTGYYNDESNWENDVLYIGNHLIAAKDTISGAYEIKDVTKTIARFAFYGCTGLTSITIPDSVTSIGWGTFSGCTGLTSVTITDSVTSIGDSAFRDCIDLTSIKIDEENPVYDSRNNCNAIIETETNTLIQGCKNTVIPNSVISIGMYAFDDCTGLTSITIPNSVTSIGEKAFYGCTGLTSITIPNSVTSIGEKAFYGCTGLTSITIPDSVTSIGSCAFEYCTGLTSITIPDSVTDISNYAFYGCPNLANVKLGIGLVNIGNYAFGIGYSEECSLTTIKIPDSVTNIGTGAFKNQARLTNVTLGKSVKYIADSAFFGCTGLTSITIPDSVTSIGDCVFVGCTGLTSIKVGEGNTIYDSRNNCNALIETKTNTLIQGCKDTVIPDSVTSIGDSAFDDCTGLTSITIPDSVTSIGNFAFYECTGLTSIIIPDSVTSIAYAAFSDCTELTSVTIDNGITYIGDKAFYGCTELTNISIPDSVTSTYSDAFSNTGYYNDESNWENDVLYIGNHLIAAKDTISGAYEIKDVTKTIARFAFYGCTGLTSIIIPDSVTSIGYAAFYGCTGLTSITIPNSVTSIGEYAFSGCTELTSITIPDSVTSIGGSAFNNTRYYNDESNWENDVLYIGNHLIKAKETISGTYKIKDGTKTIADVAFSYGRHDIGYNLLTSIIIPDSVTNIGNSAFYTCESLTSITIPDSVISIGASAFSRCSSLERIKMSNSVTSIGDSAFYYCRKLSDVYYSGTKEEWDNISIQKDNDRLIYATIHFNYISDIPNDFILTDESTGIKIEYSTELDNDTEILVDEIFDGESLQLISAVYGEVKTKLFNISLQKDGNKVQPSGEVTVKIPLPADFNPEKVFVTYVDSNNGKATRLDCEVKDSYIVFKTDHFSYYAIVEQTGGTEQPGTVESVSLGNVTMDYKSSKTLTPEIVASEGTDYTVTYSSDSKNVTVDENGKIYAAKRGSANITVTVTDSNGNTVTDTCKVEVKYTWWQWIIKIVLFGWIWY